MAKCLENIVRGLRNIGLAAILAGTLSMGCNYSPKTEVKEPSQEIISSLKEKPIYSKEKSYKNYKIAIEFYLDEVPEICLINTDGSEQKRLAKGLHPIWSSDGRKIAFLRNWRNNFDFEIWTMNKDGNEQKMLKVNYPNGPLSWSPDGKKIVFESIRTILHGSSKLGDWTNTYEIYVMSADGSGEKKLTNSSMGCSKNPSWSPDGRKIVFLSNRDYIDHRNLEIYVMNADGSEQKRLAKGLHPIWSPDSRKIIFVSKKDRDNNSNEIYVMNADGSEQKRLTTNHNISDESFFPSWSPDGKKIVFVSRRDKEGVVWNSEIYVMNADGSEQKNLTNNPAWDSYPSWSPDSKLIAFLSDRDRNENKGEIYIMNPDGTNVKRLTKSEGFISNFSWSPSLK